MTKRGEQCTEIERPFSKKGTPTGGECRGLARTEGDNEKLVKKLELKPLAPEVARHQPLRNRPLAATWTNPCSEGNSRFTNPVVRLEHRAS